ncbi:M15 family metallopeptidase [Paenibacillus sp. URB8-2]|uniref:M15 family metallopeptidase n=1 Tax=Paenibacillus sp. URB8-2 TaxID=2741301 RepID=UPI0015B86295|nr:M15 family metallopeptidase [Paenibacillus sp. URB8-2]BCG57497.1 hypothetical protein PUR_09220 [Paenibacillus sp. URB8-2]
MTLTLEQVKSKSAKRLLGLAPVVLAAALLWIERCYTRRGVAVIITQGLRTCAEQDALYALGRTVPGDIVTNARGGESNHNFGYAIDFALLLEDGRTVSWDTLRDADIDSLPDWSEAIDEAEICGFKSGAKWRTFKDMPHLEMTFGLSTADFRAGKRPIAPQVNAVFSQLTKLKEADELSAEDKKRLDTLEAAIAELGESRDVLKKSVLEQGNTIDKVVDRVAGLERRAALPTVPVWADKAVKAAHDAGLIDMPNGGSVDLYRILTVLYRAGLLAIDEED